MQRSELGKVLDKIKNNYYIQTYIALKSSAEFHEYYTNALAFVLGICTTLMLDDLISDSQIDEMLEATSEYMHTKSSKRLDTLFDEIKKGVKK